MLPTPSRSLSPLSPTALFSLCGVAGDGGWPGLVPGTPTTWVLSTFAFPPTPHGASLVPLGPDSVPLISLAICSSARALPNFSLTSAGKRGDTPLVGVSSVPGWRLPGVLCGGPSGLLWGLEKKAQRLLSGASPEGVSRTGLQTGRLEAAPVLQSFRCREGGGHPQLRRPRRPPSVTPVSGIRMVSASALWG